jgi:DNA-binding LacI/PurR family transcriptional regulator
MIENLAGRADAPSPATLCIVLSEHLTSHYTGPLAEGAVATAIALGHRLVLYSPLHLALDRSDFTLADLPLLPQGVDAYLLPAYVADDVIAFCKRNGAAVLTYAGVHPELPSIGPDNRSAARAAVAHLIGHGRRRIVHVAGPRLSGEAVERHAGYRDALEAAGIPYDPALVVRGEFRVGESRDSIARLIAAGVAFDGVFAGNDLSARGAADALQAAGLHIPDDVALIGFDDAAGIEAVQPPLSTVRQSSFEIGRQAVLALSAARYDSIAIESPLVLRESCGCRPHSIARAPEWDAELAMRLGAGQGPIVMPPAVREWMELIDTPIERLNDWMATLDIWMAAARANGWYMPALRDALDIWRAWQIDRDVNAARVEALHATARDRLSLANERYAQRIRLDRDDRMNIITYLIDMLRERPAEQALDIVLQAIVRSGARRAITVQRLIDGALSAYLAAPGRQMRAWMGDPLAFPSDDWLEAGETLLLMPLKNDAEGRIGLIGLVERDARGRLDLDDLLLRSIGTFRSIALLNETLRELDVARSVQQSLLPRRVPEHADLDIAGASRTARQVGGDLYGYYTRPDDSLALAVGDVAGKGMPAALLMSACVAALAGAMQSDLSPGRALLRIHEILLLSIGRGQNAAIGLVYLDGRKAKVASAGAIAPVLYHNAGASLLEVGGLPLGTSLSARLPYNELTIDLASGDMLILSSDGIVEAMNARGEMFGFERFLAAIEAGPASGADAMLQHLFRTVDSFVGDAEIHDDMALVVVRYAPG